MANIYDYMEPALYLKDKLAEIKKKNSTFSLRAWAKHLGMKSHGPLHAILNQQRNIPKKLVHIFVKSLKLERTEAKYFEALVDYQRAKKIDEKEYYLRKLEQLSPKPLREIDDVEKYKYITDPIHIILAEITQLKNYQDKAPWIKKHFRINQNLREIDDILNRLKSIGVIEKAKDKVIKPAKHIYTTYEIESSVVQNYHKQCSQMAIDLIDKQSIEDKEFNGITFNIEKRNLPKMKEELREFINQLVAEYEAKPHKGDETYQLNLQLFSLTK